MTLLDDLTDPENFRSNTGLGCTACEFVANLTDEERAAFVALLDNPRVPAAAIERVLARNDITLKSGVIGRHRRKECRGPRR